MNAQRGRWKKLPGNENISVFPIFHPAYLLRNPQKTKGSPKWQTWQDMQEVKNALEYYKKVNELTRGPDAESVGSWQWKEPTILLSGYYGPSQRSTLQQTS